MASKIPVQLALQAEDGSGLVARRVEAGQPLPGTGPAVDSHDEAEPLLAIYAGRELVGLVRPQTLDELGRQGVSLSSLSAGRGLALSADEVTRLLLWATPRLSTPRQRLSGLASER